MICDLCKLLYNPLKRELLVRICTARDGVNVGILADEMLNRGLVPSGVSQYLNELARVGVIRRSRAGRYVNYFPNVQNVPSDLKLATDAFVKAVGSISDSTFNVVFGALMNPFRARVVSALAKSGSISAVEICERTEHQIRYLKRDLQAAVEAGLIRSDDSEISQAVYHFIPQTEPFIATLVSLLS